MTKSAPENETNAYSSLLNSFTDNIDELQYLIRGSYGPLEIDLELVQEIVDQLVDPSNSLIYIISEDFDEESFENTEPWFGEPYHTYSIPEDLKEKLLSSFIAFENQYSTDNSYVNELRGEAITNFEKTGFPSKKNENWKFSEHFWKFSKI